MFTNGPKDPHELKSILDEKSRVEEEIRMIQRHLHHIEEQLKTCTLPSVEYQNGVEDLLALQASLAESSTHAGFLDELISEWRLEHERPPADPT